MDLKDLRDSKALLEQLDQRGNLGQVDQMESLETLVRLVKLELQANRVLLEVLEQLDQLDQQDSQDKWDLLVIEDPLDQQVSLEIKVLRERKALQVHLVLQELLVRMVEQGLLGIKVPQVIKVPKEILEALEQTVFPVSKVYKGLQDHKDL